DYRGSRSRGHPLRAVTFLLVIDGCGMTHERPQLPACYTGWTATQEREFAVPINDPGGEFSFDGGSRSRDACRAPLTRKSDGTSVNCGQSVRSRSLIRL